MGPRAFAHGDRIRRFCLSKQAVIFNGAAGFRPRRLESEFRFELLNPIFNGAAAFRPRRLDASEKRPSSISVLQWGRGLSPTETRKRRLLALRNRSFFNGAAGFRPRRLARNPYRIR